MSTWNKAIKPFLACWHCKCDDDIDFNDTDDKKDDSDDVDDDDSENKDDDDDDQDVDDDYDVPEDRWGTSWGCPPPFGIAQCPRANTERNNMITFF